MAKRGYKLQEFVAHGSDVNCLRIGKKSCKIFTTGGEDRKVNLWAIGNQSPLLTFSGHTSSVQSVAFDSEEVLLLAGCSNGTIKLWDLEEAKLVRTVTGHRSNCTAAEFHPFGEFFASGSLDTDLKIWDIRKKGCIHTYKGHTRGIRAIRFTPDGRWVVTGGEDHVVKVWDLTAGKLLHDFKFHNGTIRCIDFHPQEFLLATGSVDRTVNFWDLETFELIGSAGPEATGVRSMVFHPDGRTLFCGLDDTLKVLSWEPIRCHDFVEMGWSTLGDIGIYEGKLLGCSYHQSRVGVWVADISLIGPYGVGGMPKTNVQMEPIDIYVEDHSPETKGGSTNSGVILVEEPPEYGGKSKDTPECSPMIPNICGRSLLKEDPVCSSKMSCIKPTESERDSADMSCHNAAQKLTSKFSLKVPNMNSTTSRVGKASEGSAGNPNSSREMLSSSKKSRGNCRVTSKKHTMVELQTANGTRATGGPVLTPVFVPRESLSSGSLAFSGKSTPTAETKGARKIHHMHQPSFSSDGGHSQLFATVTRPSSSPIVELGSVNSTVARNLVASADTVKPDGSNCTSITKFAKKFEKTVSLEQHLGLHNDEDAESSCTSSETGSVKYVRGVAVQLGKTRSLVERWENRERCNNSCSSTVNSSPERAFKLNRLQPVQNGETHETTRVAKEDGDFGCEDLLQGHDIFINLVKSRLTKLQMIRHVWEHNGIKDAIDAVAKLPDYSVQVDVISILLDRIDILTLDIFSCLLPVLLGLLSSKTDRHVTVSLELLFELNKIFGGVIQSTISASSMVGVDLQAERRLERCKQCYSYLQKIRQSLPLLIRNGGLLAKHAQKLSVALNGL